MNRYRALLIDPGVMNPERPVGVTLPSGRPVIRIWREVLDAVLLDAARTTPRTAKSVIGCLLGCLDDAEAFQVFQYLHDAPSPTQLPSSGEDSPAPDSTGESV